MKFPVSRRLKTWNSNIFTELCPFGCGVEENVFLDNEVNMFKIYEQI